MPEDLYGGPCARSLLRGVRHVALLLAILDAGASEARAQRRRSLD